MASQANNLRFSRAPIILGGCPRSGTSLLLSILSACRNIFCIPEEVWAFYDTEQLSEFDYYVRKLLWPKIPAGTEAKYQRWCEKTPRNVLAFRNIIEYFGQDARLIHIVRDGRDVITSRHPHAPDKYWVPDWMWLWYVTEGLRFADHPQVLTLRYEDLVTNFEPTIRSLCDFIGEVCTENIMNWFDNTLIRKHSAWFEPVGPLSDKSIGRGLERSNEVISEFLKNKEAVTLLTKLGYA